MGNGTRGKRTGSLSQLGTRLAEIWYQMWGLGPATVALVDDGYGPVFSRRARTFARPKAVTVQPAEPEPCRLAGTVGGDIQTVTVWPGQSPENLIDQLVKVPPTAALVETFGDGCSVPVFGPRDVEPRCSTPSAASPRAAPGCPPTRPPPSPRPNSKSPRTGQLLTSNDLSTPTTSARSSWL
jgi:uncharacterized repeat protein (TIGR03917 family)